MSRGDERRALQRARQAEQALVESEQKYRTLAESLPQLIWTCTPAGDCNYLCAQWSQYTGRPPEEHLERGWLESLHPADRKRASDAWLAASQEGGQYDVQYRIRRHDGIYRWFQTRGVPLRDPQGHITQWLGTCTDIHAQKEAAEDRAVLLAREKAARQEAEHANHLKDDFLATLSHELRTPLNAILGWAQLLRMGQMADEHFKEALDTIDRNARAQAQLIDDLLDVSRIISGKLRLDVQPVDLTAVILSAIGSVATAAEAKSIRIQPMLDPAASTVSGDAGRLQQIVWNLLSNAIKFTHKGGRVMIQLARVNSHVEISVSDTGQGIDPAFLPFVFERFRQADASTRRTYGGLGLGLAIVRQLVELHGGSVSAHSRGGGQGSTFTVRLPQVAVVPEQSRAATENAPREECPELPADLGCPPELEGIRVVVVDDERDARELLRRVLEGCKAKVSVASSAQEAIELFEEFQPDILISDIGMPHQDGFDLIRRIRELEGRRDGRVPAIALTAFARSDDRRRALLAGFQTHVSKPVIPSELVAIVASLVGKTG